MIKSLVSIIVPVYKVERFLEKCILSITNQSYPHIEIILVDDGSPDKCPIICDELALRDNRIRVIHKTNSGVTYARIDGFKASKGDYISFVDADDTLEYNAIEELIKNSIKYDTDITVCQAYLCSDNEKKLQYKAAKFGYYSKEDIKELLENNFLFDNNSHYSAFPLYLWGKLYKRNILNGFLEKGIGFWYGEDMVAILPIIKESKSMYISEKPLYNYLQNQSQVTRKPMKNLFPQYEKIWTYIEETDTDGAFHIQLPQRIWWICMVGMNVAIKNNPNYKEFKELFYLIRKSPIVQRKTIDSKFQAPQTPTYRILHFLFRNNLAKPYFLFVRYKYRH